VVNPHRDAVDHRQQPEQARPAQAHELAGAQHNRLFPLAGHTQGEQNVDAWQQADDQGPAAHGFRQPGIAQHHRQDAAQDQESQETGQA